MCMRSVFGVTLNCSFVQLIVDIFLLVPSPLAIFHLICASRNSLSSSVEKRSHHHRATCEISLCVIAGEIKYFSRTGQHTGQHIRWPARKMPANMNNGYQIICGKMKEKVNSLGLTWSRCCPRGFRFHHHCHHSQGPQDESSYFLPVE